MWVLVSVVMSFNHFEMFVWVQTVRPCHLFSEPPVHFAMRAGPPRYVWQPRHQRGTHLMLKCFASISHYIDIKWYSVPHLEQTNAHLGFRNHPKKSKHVFLGIWYPLILKPNFPDRPHQRRRFEATIGPLPLATVADHGSCRGAWNFSNDGLSNCQQIELHSCLSFYCKVASRRLSFWFSSEVTMYAKDGMRDIFSWRLNNLWILCHWLVVWSIFYFPSYELGSMPGG